MLSFGGNATNQVTTGRTEAYTYDDLSRLSTVNYGDGERQHYAFDAMGNRTEKDDTVGSTTVPTSYASDAANRLTATMAGSTTSTYANDVDGNTTSGGGRTNVWDSQNRLVSSTAATGTHAAGKTRWYVYDGLGSVVGEVDPSGNLTSSGTFDVYSVTCKCLPIRIEFR